MRTFSRGSTPLPTYATSSCVSACTSPTETVTPSSLTPQGRRTLTYLHKLLMLALTYLYGAIVAALYTWHSFRSGLATALHAANVPDAMIMLICRWMCPESLHVYRRMGTREHERLINEASTMNVDAIQSANVVRVVGDQGYAALFADLQLNQSTHSKDFDRTTNTAPNARTRQLTPAQPTSPTAPPPLKQPQAACDPRSIWPSVAESEPSTWLSLSWMASCHSTSSMMISLSVPG